MDFYFCGLWMSHLLLVPRFLLYFPLANKVSLAWFMRMVYGSNYQGLYLKSFQLFNYLKYSEDLEPNCVGSLGWS